MTAYYFAVYLGDTRAVDRTKVQQRYILQEVGCRFESRPVKQGLARPEGAANARERSLRRKRYDDLPLPSGEA